MASPPPADVDPSAASRLSLRGRRALVTGGHRGIGAAVVLGLAAAGAHVAVIDRGGAAARSSDIPSRVRGYGVEFYATAADLADVDATVAAVGRVQAEFGAIDILVNNACVLGGGEGGRGARWGAGAGVGGGLYGCGGAGDALERGWRGADATVQGREREGSPAAWRRGRTGSFVARVVHGVTRGGHARRGARL